MGTAIGPFLGGWLVAAVSWWLIFVINLPLAAIVVAVTWRHVPETRDPDGTGPVDVTGGAAATLGLIGLTYGLIECPVDGWARPPVPTALTGGLILLGAFVGWERRAPVPMLPLNLFSSTGTLAALIGAGMASAVNNDVARAAALIAVALLPAAGGITSGAYRHAAQFSAGFHTASLISAALCLAGGALAAVIIRNPRRPKDEAAAAGEQLMHSPGAEGGRLSRAGWRSLRAAHQRVQRSFATAGCLRRPPPGRQSRSAQG